MIVRDWLTKPFFHFKEEERWGGEKKKCKDGGGGGKKGGTEGKTHFQGEKKKRLEGVNLGGGGEEIMI